MGSLEDALRETFARRVAGAPSTDGLADRAMLHARRIRRSRTVAASAAATLCVSLAAWGTVALTGASNSAVAPAGPSTTPQTSVEPLIHLPVDVLLDDRILVRGGGEVPLDRVLAGSGSGGFTVRVQGAWRVTGGWLVHVYTWGERSLDGDYVDTERLWLVDASGNGTILVIGNGIMVSPPVSLRLGIQVAWVADATLHVATYVNRGLDGHVTTPVPYSSGPDPVRLHPQLAVGGAILLAGTQTGGGLDTWGAWFPGDRVVTDLPVLEPLGLSQDRSRVIVRRHPSGAPACIGQFDPAAPAATDPACVAQPVTLHRVAPSPDGRWLAVLGADGPALYGTRSFWNGGDPVRAWPYVGGGEVAWLDSGEFFAIMGTDRVTTIRIGREPGVTMFGIPDSAGTPELVPDLSYED